jgi:hypothetical protein
MVSASTYIVYVLAGYAAMQHTFAQLGLIKVTLQHRDRVHMHAKMVLCYSVCIYLLEVVLVAAVAALTPARYTAASFTATPLTSFAPAAHVHIHRDTRYRTHRESDISDFGSIINDEL